MATIDTIQDLLRLLDENPEWVDALRARLLTQDLLELPERFAQFVAEMTDFRTEVNRFVAEMTDFRAEVNRFVEATDRRFDALEVRQARADEDIKAIRRDIAVLKGGHARTSALRDSATMARSMGLRRIRTLTQDDLWDLTESADTSDIHANVLTSFRRADLVMETTDAERRVCYIAAEISFTVHDRDISRASRNSRFLTRFTGRPAFAAVAGERVDSDVQDVIDSGGVFWHQINPRDLEVE